MCLVSGTGRPAAIASGRKRSPGRSRRAGRCAGRASSAGASRRACRRSRPGRARSVSGSTRSSTSASFTARSSRGSASSVARSISVCTGWVTGMPSHRVRLPAPREGRARTLIPAARSCSSAGSRRRSAFPLPADPPELGRAAVAQHGVVPAGEHRGHPAAVRRELRPSHRVDAARRSGCRRPVATRCSTPRRENPSLQQVAPRHHPVLRSTTPRPPGPSRSHALRVFDPAIARSNPRSASISPPPGLDRPGTARSAREIAGGLATRWRPRRRRRPSGPRRGRCAPR